MSKNNALMIFFIKKFRCTMRINVTGKHRGNIIITQTNMHWKFKLLNLYSYVTNLISIDLIFSSINDQCKSLILNSNVY